MQKTVRTVTLTWNKADHATGYMVSYGVNEKELYHNYQVYNATTATINNLATEQKYYFTIEAFNENGITPANTIVNQE